VQHNNERDLISSWRSGDLSAAHAFVRSRQSEVLSIAYLMTTNRDLARGLAQAAFIGFFREARSLDPDADHRTLLLVRVGRCFLRKEFEAEPESQSGFLSDSAPQKYGVETQRARMLAALGRLDEHERVALVLGEVAGFGPAELNRVLERGGSALVAPVETARQRLRQSLDIAQGNPVRPALLEAGFDGPRDNLWPQIEAEVAEIQHRDQRRGQIVSYGVVGIVILVIVVGLIALFGTDLIDSSNDGPSMAVEATVAAGAEDEEIPTQPTSIPPTPTPTPVPLPVGDVPDILLAYAVAPDGSSDGPLDLMAYDSASNEFHTVDGAYDLPSFSQMQWVQLSPTGDHVILIHQDREAQAVRLLATTLDSRTMESQWEIAIAEPKSPSGLGEPDLPGIAVSSDRLYIATHEALDQGRIRLDAYDLHDGTARESITINVDRDNWRSGVRHRIMLYLVPDESGLVIAHGVARTIGRQLQETALYHVALPDLEQTSSESDVDARVDTGPFFEGWGASITPDSNALYQLFHDVSSQQSRIEFLSIDTGEISTLEIPFPDHPGMAYQPLTTVMSNDGYRMYLIDPLTANVAIVNLSEQRLERFFSIDTGPLSSLFGIGPDQFTFGGSGRLSLDGTRLYLAAGYDQQGRANDMPEESGVWVLDLHEWRVVRFVAVEGMVLGVDGGFDEETLLVRVWREEAPDTGDSSAWLRVSMSDENTLIEPLGGGAIDAEAELWVFSLFDMYRQQHGRSPSVDGVLPADIETFSTLPRIEATAPRNVVSEVSTSIEVRVLDPASGQILRSPRDDVRFDPNSTMTALLTTEDQPGQLVILGPVEAGIYRGNASLPAEGTWAINVSIIEPDGSTALASNAGSVEVSPTLFGSDGNRYQFRLRFDPRQPVINEQASFKLRLVDVESGAIVSPDVHFDVDQPVLEGARIGMLPERLSISLANPGTLFGSRTILAGQVGAGVWEGRITFQDSGVWTTSVRLHLAGAPFTEIPTGRVDVLEAP
jgi:DNA-directed RNA polymerase specialized sigma24 family protein